MKRSSLTTKASSRRTLRTRRLLQVIAGFTLIIILGLIIPRVFAFVGTVALSPYHVVRLWITESDDALPVFFRDRHELLTQISELEAKVAGAEGGSNSVRKLLSENMELRSLLGATTSPRIAAQVTARPNQLPYDLLQIDQGSKDGIVRGAPVFLGRDQVIGYVTEVSRSHAFVELVTASGYSSTVYIVGPNVYTTAEGMGGGIMRVRVPQGIPLRTGNLVLLPAVNAGIYGEIVSVESVPTQPQQYGYLSPQISMQGLRYVAVGTESIKVTDFDEAETLVKGRLEQLFTVDVPLDRLVDIDATSTATSSAVQATSTGPLELEVEE